MSLAVAHIPDSPGVASNGAHAPEVSVIIPCMNEAATLREVIADVRGALEENGYRGEILVVDSGSSDDSASIAERERVRFIGTLVPGYGAACLRGFEEARGDYFVIIDGDGTYSTESLARFIEPLRCGIDLVLGTRRNGVMQPGAMSRWHRHLWEPIQTYLLRKRFGMQVSDVRCGMRGISRAAAQRLAIHGTGMEFSGEMIRRAAESGMQVIDVPVTFRPRPQGVSRRKTEDGWRIVRQILLLSPTQVFVAPGMACLLLGLGIEFALLPGRISVTPRLWFDYHFMFVGAIIALLGFQLILLGLYAKTYATLVERNVPDRWLLWFHDIYTLERGLFVGGAVFLAGLLMNARTLIIWLAAGRAPVISVRPVILALTFMVLGAEVVFASFFLSLLRANSYHRA